MVSAIGASKVSQFTSIDQMLDGDFKSTQNYFRMKELFQNDHQFVVAFEKKTDFSREDLCVLDTLGQDLVDTYPEITRFQSPFTIRKGVHDPKKRTLWFPRVLDPVCKDLSTSPDLLKTLERSPWKGTFLPSLIGHHDISFEIFFEAEFDHQKIPELKKWIEERVANRGFELHYSGESYFQYYTDQGYQWMDRMNLLIVAMLMAWCWFFFRTWSSGIILLVTLAFTGTILRGMMGFLHVPIDIVSSNLFLMLSVSCIEDYVLLSAVRMKNPNWKSAFRKILVPGFITSLTTLVGFWSLGNVDLGMIRRFGWIAGAGAMIEWFMVFIFLPCAMKEWKRLQQWTRGPHFQIWSRLDARLKSIVFPKWFLYVSLLVFPMGVWGLMHLHYQENPEKTFWADHPFRQGLDYLQKTRGYRNEINLVFESDATESKKEELNQWLKTVPEVTVIERPEEVMAEIFENVPTEVAESMKGETRMSAPFKRWYSETEEEKWILYWKDTETNRMAEFTQQVDQHCEGQCFLSGSFVAYSEMGTRIRKTLLESLGTSLALVGLILVWLARHQGFKNYALILASAFWGSFATISLLWLAHTPIYFISCLFAATLVGLAGDNVVQYLWGSRKKGRIHQLHELGLGTGMVTLSIIGMSCCFFVAYFVPARSLGLLLAVGLIAMFYGDFFLWKGFQKKS